MENKKTNLQKHNLLKKQNQYHKILIARYKEYFDPLLLPKLAIIGCQIKSDSSCQSFISRLLLYGKNLIQKQNRFICVMKEILKEKYEKISKKQVPSYDEFNQITPKQTAFDIKFEQNRHTYSELLTNRLKDLNQLILHIERHEKVPQLEKECRNLLEIEIIRIEETKSNFGPKKKQNKKQEDLVPKLFNLVSHRQDQAHKRKQMIKKLYQREKHKRMVTQPYQSIIGINQISEVSKRNKSKKATYPFQQKQNTETVKQGKSNRHNSYKMNTTSSIRHKRNQLIDFDKHATERIKPQPENKYKLIYTKTQESQAKQANYKNFRFGNSVRFNLEQSNQKALSKYPNQKYEKMIRNRQLQEDEINKTPQSNKSSKKVKSLYSKSLKQSYDGSESSKEGVLQQRRDRKNKKQVKFNQNFQQVQRKDYINKPYNLRSKHIKRDGIKISWTVIPMFQDIQHERQRSRSNESKYSKYTSKKTTRRQGLFQQIHKDFKNVQGRKRTVRGKRNGVKLNAKTNKHLVRLLRETNIQDLMISNEFQEKPSFIKIKNRQGQISNQIKIKQNGKNIINKKNEILLQVDLQASSKDKYKLRNSESDSYVKNCGFKVSASDRVNLKEFVKINPYHYREIANFYGGQKINQIHYELITNEEGQYSFNRQFIYRIKKVKDEQYEPFKFPTVDPCDYLGIQISRHLIKNSNDIDQKSINDIQILL